jgi:ceramide glucosyltransferase
MNGWLALFRGLLLVPIAGGVVYGIACVVAVRAFSKRYALKSEQTGIIWPPVTVLKPIYGMEKELKANLQSICSQDYPDYQVVLSVQRLDDPALPLLWEIAEEFGPKRVSVVAIASEPVVNGKVQNLIQALTAARHEVLIISDSDVQVRSDYLKAIVAPLQDPEVGCTCTFYRARGAWRWFERLELLTLNADFTADLIFAAMTGASDFCIGCSLALKRSTLELIGGLGSLAEYLVEDYEIGRRIQAQGLGIAVVPYFVDIIVDLQTPLQWWRHQLYWDQNTRAAKPWGFLATVLTRAVPFALLYAMLRMFNPASLMILGGVLAVRLSTCAFVLGYGLGDREGLRSLPWLPLRDLAGLVSWLLVLRKRSFVWRGLEFGLTRDGRIVPRTAQGLGPRTRKVVAQELSLADETPDHHWG